MSRSRFGLSEAVRQSDLLDAGSNSVVVVDQFEELFRFRGRDAANEEASEAFIKLLLTASREESPRVYVVLTMHSDYLGGLRADPWSCRGSESERVPHSAPDSQPAARRH